MTDNRPLSPEIAPEALPVPNPWGTAPLRARFGRRALLGSGVVLVTVAALLGVTRLLGWAPPVEHPAQAWVPVAVLGGIGLLELRLAKRSAAQRRLPELVSAVTVARPGVRPADDWTHLFRIRGAGSGGVIVLLLFGAFALGAGVLGVLAALGVVAVAEPGKNQLILGLVGGALGLVGAGLVWAAALSARASRRGASFGERSAGVSIGPTAILVHAAGIDREIPWASVRAVTAERIGAGAPVNGLLDAADRLTLDGAVRQPIDVIRLEVAGEPPQLLARATSASAPEVLFNVLRLGHEVPQFRAELGTTAGQRRLEAWTAGLPAR